LFEGFDKRVEFEHDEGRQRRLADADAPAVSGGFIPGEVNHVGHKAIGQCALLI
jgi:hypothetical protein